MLTDLLILIAAAIGAGSIVYLSIFLLNNMRSPSEVLKQELTIDNDDVNLIIKTEGNINPSEVLEMIKDADKGIVTVNEARKIAGFEPFNEFQKAANEFQKVAHDFGETKTPPTAKNKNVTIRTARICQNCGSNVFEPAKSIFSMTCAYCGTKYDTNKNMFDN